MSIFRLFELLFFIAQKGVFFVLQYHKRNFPGLYCPKKKLEKWPFLDQSDGLTRLEKCQFFDCLSVLFFLPRNAFFCLECHERGFPGLYCLKKKSWINGHFWTKNHGLSPLEKCQFFDCLNFLFLQPRKAFFSFYNIIKDIFLALIA